MRCLFEIYRTLDDDARIHREALERDGKLTVPVLATGGGAQALAGNYAPMMRELAEDVTRALVPDAGHWVAEENPEAFTRLLVDFDAHARSLNTKETIRV